MRPTASFATIILRSRCQRRVGQRAACLHDGVNRRPDSFPRRFPRWVCPWRGNGHGGAGQRYFDLRFSSGEALASDTLFSDGLLGEVQRSPLHFLDDFRGARRIQLKSEKRRLT